MSDTGNNLVRQINSSRYVNTFAGISTLSRRISAALSARLNLPLGIAVDSLGNVFVVDSGNKQIIKINTASNSISTVLNITSAQTSLAVDKSNSLWVTNSTTIQAVSPRGSIQTVLAPSDSVLYSSAGLVFTHNGTLASSSSILNIIALFAAPILTYADSTSLVMSSTVESLLSTLSTATVFTSTEIGSLISSTTIPTLSSTSDLTSSLISIELSTTVSRTSATATITSTTAQTQTSTSMTQSNQAPSYPLPQSSTYLSNVTSDVSMLSSSLPFSSLSSIVSSSSAFAFTRTQGLSSTSSTTQISPSSTPTLLPNNGIVSSLAGSGTPSFADGVGIAAAFNQPIGVAVDSSGTVYVADSFNQRIRKITAGGVVSTLAGSGSVSFADGLGTAAAFNNPNGVAVDSNGVVYVADSNNCRIRNISVAGIVSTLAGSGTTGFADGVGTAAAFNYPFGIAVDSGGTVYVGDSFNHRIRKITAAGVVSTLAGSGSAGLLDGIGAAAAFSAPYGVAVDRYGVVYVADTNNYKIRKVSVSGAVTTLAGSGDTNNRYADGVGIAAAFDAPMGVSVDSSGTVYVADTNNNRIRRIALNGNVTTFAGSASVFPFANGVGTAASFYYPMGIVVDSNGVVYVGDRFNNIIRKIQ